MRTSVETFTRVATMSLFIAAADFAHGFYEPVVQRWINRDPMGELGFDLRRQIPARAERDGLNGHFFVWNSPLDRVDPNGLFLGWGYGNWCGWSQSGPGNPIDEVDAACKTHDYCLATVVDFLIPAKRFCCNAAFCGRVAAANCSRSPNPIACEDARIDIMALCVLVLINGPLLGL